MIAILVALALPLEPAEIDRTAQTAYAESSYTFCTSPKKPLLDRQRSYCALADVPGCEGFRAACAGEPRPADVGWLRKLLASLAPIAKLMLYGLVAMIALVIVIPLIKALRDRRRRERLTKELPRSNLAFPVARPPIDTTSADAEVVFELAEAHRVRGELEPAIALFLEASLAALDRRGAIRRARHRTNGEYVRACSEDASRPALRQIVRDVDRVEFGGAAPTTDDALQTSRRARAIVRIALGAIVVLALGCGGQRRGSDPAGSELPTDVLQRSGFTVGPLGSSLATMPMPGDTGAPVVIVDLERVPVEDDARAHLVRWTEAGGVLVLLGEVAAWPSELGALSVAATTTRLKVDAGDPNGGLEDVDRPDRRPRSVVVEDARVARHDAITSTGDPVAFLGDHVYATKRSLGKGLVLGLANDDLFTNIGVLQPRNAAALVLLIRSASHDARRSASGKHLNELRVARAEDGIPPPGDPFSALVAAGLAKGAAHALVAAILLFLAVGIRHARARPTAAPVRRAFVEHVEATGAFYGRARAHGHALAAYGTYVDLRLRELVPRGTDPLPWLARATGTPLDRILELHRRATAPSSGEPQGDELTLIEDLRHLLEHPRS